METARNDKENRSSDEISIKDIFNAISRTVAYIRQRWITVLIAAIIGALLGLTYSILKKPTYTAVCTFVLEDEKSSGGLGQYAGLASLAGINLGASGGGGIFQGDNILELYTSRTMIEKALLVSCNFNGKSQLLIDRFIDFNNFRFDQTNNDKIADLRFSCDPNKFNRRQDSMITALVEFINKRTLSVTKPDKKLSIINVQVASKDELFSKFFTENLVQTVNQFYVATKIKKEAQNVQILQHQVDSVKTILNSSINGVASANDAAPNANPQLSILRVASQKRQVDVQANSAIYSEMVKNLELAKISLRQEMPLIQIIDKPVLPLHVDNVGKLKGLIIGMALGTLVIILVFMVQKTSKKIKIFFDEGPAKD